MDKTPTRMVKNKKRPSRTSSPVKHDPNDTVKRLKPTIIIP